MMFQHSRPQIYFASLIFWCTNWATFYCTMKVIYNTLFKKTSTYAVAIMGSVFFFERGFDLISESLFTSVNKGKLWDDIKSKYE